MINDQRLRAWITSVIKVVRSNLTTAKLFDKYVGFIQEKDVDRDIFSQATYLYIRYYVYIIYHREMD